MIPRFLAPDAFSLILHRTSKYNEGHPCEQVTLNSKGEEKFFVDIIRSITSSFWETKRRTNQDGLDLISGPFERRSKVRDWKQQSHSLLLTLEKQITVHSTTAWKWILKTAMQAWNKILHPRWDYEPSSVAALWDEFRPETQLNYAWIPDPGGFKPLRLWLKVCSSRKQVLMKGSSDGSDNSCDFKVLMSMNCILLRLSAITEMWCEGVFFCYDSVTGNATVITC